MVNPIDMYRQQINHDASQANYLVEGGTYIINVSKVNAGNPATITTATTAKIQVPIDTLVESMAFIAYIDNPNNPGVGDCIPSPSVKINIRDTLSQENWIFTTGGSLGQGAPVPVNLLFGPFPTQLPSPRPLLQNTLLEIDIEPDGFPIIDFNLTFIGRRMDMMPPWERQQVCGDPRTSGAYWIYFDPKELVRADNAADPCRRGRETSSFLRIPVLPFDILITAWSGFVTETTTSATPIARAWYDFKLTDMNNKKTLNDGYIPSTILGGSTLNSSVVPPALAAPLDLNQVLEYIPRTTPMNNAWIIRQQSAISFDARAAYSPLDPTTFPTMTAQLMLSGMRVPTSEISAGFPYYNRQDGSLRCPPGSNGVVPGYPGGPAGSYAGGPYAGPQPPYAGGPQSPQGLSGGYPPPAALPPEVYSRNGPGNWPQSMPFPPPALNTQSPVTVRNPNQEGGQVIMPNRGGGVGWGIPGGPMDGRGPRFRNEGGQ